MPLQCNICHCCCVLIYIIDCVHCILYIQHCIVYIERNACILGVEIELWGDPKNYIPALKISKYRYSILEFNIVELAFISALFIKTILT